MVSKLRSPDKNSERTLQYLTDKINELIDAVNQSGYEGDKSKVQFSWVKQANGEWAIEGETPSGRVVSVTGTFEYK